MVSALSMSKRSREPIEPLTWMRRIAVRRSQAIDEARCASFHPSNGSVYLREFQGELDLASPCVGRRKRLSSIWNSRAGPSSFFAASLPGDDLRPSLTLPAMVSSGSGSSRPRKPTTVTTACAPGLFTLVATGKLETILTGRERVAFERTVAPRFLSSRRWFGHKETQVARISVRDFAVLRDGGQSRFVLPLLDIKLPGGGAESYFAPLAAEPEHKDGPPRPRRREAAPCALTGLLYEADVCEGFVPAMVVALRRGERLDTG
jgi:maltose alpha-D-glucosyltransferase/alpha-amylase